MSARQAILDGIRDALRRPSPRPHAQAGPVWPVAAAEEPTDLPAAFRAKFETVGGHWHEAPDLAGAATVIDELTLPRGRVWLALPSLPLAGDRVFRTPPPRDELDDLAATVTGVDCAIAETGSLGVFFKPGAGRLSSLVAPVHIAVVRRDQFVSKLEHFLSRVQSHLGPRAAAVIITGPSRSADIEQVLTVGVHGPREVHAVVIEKDA